MLARAQTYSTIHIHVGDLISLRKNEQNFPVKRFFTKWRGKQFLKKAGIILLIFIRSLYLRILEESWDQSKKSSRNILKNFGGQTQTDHRTNLKKILRSIPEEF